MDANKTVKTVEKIDTKENRETMRDIMSVAPNNKDDLADVIDYASNSEKTDKQIYVSGINCSPSHARDEMVITKKRFGKEDKEIVAYHAYMSFKGQEVEPELAHQIGLEIAEKIWGKDYQVIVATHLNTQNIHNHFVINSVSFRDGHMLHDEKTWFKFKKDFDEICMKYNLSTVKNPMRATKRADYYKKLEESGAVTDKLIYRTDVDAAIANSKNIFDFVKYMNELGYRVDCRKEHKYWTITPPNRKKAMRLYRLGIGEEPNPYTNDAIIETIAYNKKARVNTNTFKFSKNFKMRFTQIQILTVNRGYKHYYITPEVKEAIKNISNINDMLTYINANKITSVEKLMEKTEEEREFNDNLRVQIKKNNDVLKKKELHDSLILSNRKLKLLEEIRERNEKISMAEEANERSKDDSNRIRRREHTTR